MREISVAELAGHLGIEFRGDGDRMIGGVAEIAHCRGNQCAYADGPWLRKIPAGAGAVLVPEVPDVKGPAWLLHEKPQRMFVEVIRLFHPEPQRQPGISESARISPEASLDADVHVAPGAIVSGKVTIGPRSAVLSGAVISGDITVGADCVVHPNVTIQGHCTIGNRTIIHSGTVIGADGYGYLQEEGRHIKIPQVGGVTIGDDVEIGANVCVDRGALGNTVIGNGVKIDNLVQIAHNVTIGDHALIVAMVGISGSSSVGSGAVLAGKVGVKDHVSIGNGAIVLANATVTSDIKGGEVYAGYPAHDADTWRRSVVIQRSLPKHWKTLKKLIRKFEDPEK